MRKRVISSDTRQISNDMEKSAQLNKSNDHRHHNRYHYHHHHRDRTPMSEIVDNGCSCCISGGSSKPLSQHGRGERLCRSSISLRADCYLERLLGRSTRSQEGLCIDLQRSSERSWRPLENFRSLLRGGISLSSNSVSPPSNTHSSSDSHSLKRSFIAETLRRAFQHLKITSFKLDSNKEKKHAKKSPKRILRRPVSYIYVRGPSGLLTQRIPRKSNFQQSRQLYSCQDLRSIERYRYVDA